MTKAGEKQTLTNLQLKADEHNQEDKAEAEDTDGQADQPPEHTPSPRRIVKLLTSRYGTAALDSLSREREQKALNSLREEEMRG